MSVMAFQITGNAIRPLFQQIVWTNSKEDIKKPLVDKVFLCNDVTVPPLYLSPGMYYRVMLAQLIYKIYINGISETVLHRNALLPLFSNAHMYTISGCD